MSNAWAAGSTTAWRRTRLAVLDRDGWLCRIQFPGEWTSKRGVKQSCQVRASCVHHTRGKRFGDDPAYLVASCSPCNLRLGEPHVSNEPPLNPITKW